MVNDKQEPIENLVTWVYEGGSFVPSAKLINGEKFSIINDYIGRPIQAYNKKGYVVWETDYDIYGDLRNQKGDKTFIPFRQLGQYEDVETGLYYNRFRYYSSETGLYLSQDPIGLLGNNPTLYAYVSDSNSWIDIFGLDPENWNITSHGEQPSPRSPYQSHHLIQDEWAKNQGFSDYSSSKAPSILLDATPGDQNMHAVVNRRQIARRDARVKAGKGKWSSTYKQEAKYMVEDLRAAGVPEAKIKEAKKAVKEYFKKCK